MARTNALKKCFSFSWASITPASELEVISMPEAKVTIFVTARIEFLFIYINPMDDELVNGA